MTEKQRLLWLDNLKGLLIFIVVLGHCIQHTLPNYTDNVAFRYIYSFHMALFMFVSGYACFRSEVKWNLVLRRANQLLIPFFIWSLIMCIIRDEFQLWDMVLLPEKSFWFLWVLFFITVFHVIACRLGERLHVKDEWISLFIAVLLLGIVSLSHTNIFSLQLIAYHYVFYTMGFYAKKYQCIERVKPVFAIIAVVAWVVSAWFWSMGKPIHQLGFNNPMFTTAYHYVVALIAIIAFMTLSCQLLNCKSLILNEMGGGTLAIYVIHLTLLSLLPKNFINVMPVWLYIITLSVVVAALSFAIFKLLLKNKVTAFLLIGK